MKYLKRGLLIVLLAGLTAYVGACVYANWFAGDGTVKAPAIDKAQYAVQIHSTRQVLFSPKVSERAGVVTLTGYYEFNGKKYLWRKQSVTLDERLFGPIDVVKRTAE